MSEYGDERHDAADCAISEREAARLDDEARAACIGIVALLDEAASAGVEWAETVLFAMSEGGIGSEANTNFRARNRLTIGVAA